MAALAACALAIAACKSGPTGGDDDTTPPPAPNLALITASPPLDGSSIVRGGAGAVEGRATVRVANVDAAQRAGGAPVHASGQAADDGSFEVAIPAVFAHELEHMISFNQHVLVRNGQPESLWLDEGLAHMAESLNGFHEQNRLRSAFFLDSPGEVSLVAGPDDLDRRGAAWLLVQYLADRFGQDILGRLVQTSSRGTGNVANASDVPFPTLFHEWTSTLLLDGPHIPNSATFEMPSVAIREDFELSKQEINVPGDPPRVGDTYLGVSPIFAPGNFVSLQQTGMSALYIAVTSRGRANVPIEIDGQSGATLQITIIRTQ